MHYHIHHSEAGDMRVAGMNYGNVSPRAIFAGHAIVIAQDNADFRVVGSESGEVSVSFEKMALVDDRQDVARLADVFVR